jgi:hypothetical protein
MDHFQQSEDVISQQAVSPHGLSQDDVFRMVYTDCYPRIKKFILSRGGKEQDIQDVLCDTFLQFSTGYQRNILCSKVAPVAYLSSIARSIWIKESLYRHCHRYYVPEIASWDGENEMGQWQERRYEIYWKHFVRMGHECKLILRDFFKGNTSLYTAEKLGISPAYYYKKKSICIKYLESKIRQDPGFKKLNQYQHGNL